MTRSHSLWLVLLWLVLLTGCRAKPAQKPPPPEPVPAERRLGILLLRNGSEKVVFRAKVQEEGTKEWSGDRLNEGDVIKPGEERSFHLPDGRYRVQLQFGDGTDWTSTWTEVDKAQVGAVDIPPAKPAPREGEIVIMNASPWAIAEVRFSRESEMSFGDNRLAGRLIAAGARVTWDVPPGRYMVQIVFQDGTHRESPASEVKPGKETVFRIER